jgi:hypothetical protein
LRGTRETGFVQQWRMEQVGSCTNLLKCLISQKRYFGKFLTYSFVVFQFLSQNRDGYLQCGEGLAGAVVQVTSHPTPLLVLHFEKPL